ncbi:hypothetical protein OEZ86_009108 [Tetradesmus obliquus]|nr:hypothetical protein OEZ86_009108 [Tetradesmus obliquus]
MHKLFGLSKQPALHKAVQSGEISDVRVMLQKCTDIDQADKQNGRSPLHVAAAAGFDVILGELLDRRSKAAGLQDTDGNTPLHLAAAGGHTRCVQLLMGSRNSDQRSRQQQLQLRSAAGYTPLMAAAAAGHAQVVDVMLLAGADMHSGVLQGRVTIGHLAARGGHVQVLAVLAAHGFDLRSDTLDMTTLLHEAAAQGQVAAVQWLLQAGLNPAARNAEQKSALDLARAEQHHTVVQVLRNAAAAAPPAAAAAAPSGSGASSEPSTPTAAVAAAIAARGSIQQQQQAGRLAGQLVVYPENEQYKFYPAVDKRVNM